MIIYKFCDNIKLSKRRKSMSLSKEEIKKELVRIYKERTNIECSKMIVEEDEPEILDNKIYGNPYLPVGVDYPKDSKGENMPLLLQVNLKDVNLKEMPNKGILEVFISQDVDNLEYKVLCFDEGQEYQTEFPKFDLDFDNFFFEEPIKIRLEKSFTDMPLANYEARDIIFDILKELTGETFESLWDVEDYLEEEYIGDVFVEDLDYTFGNIGGYGDFTQYDPRDDDEDLQKYDKCLFKIDSSLDINRISIIDSGIIFGFISAEDLKNGNFENTYINFDFC